MNVFPDFGSITGLHSLREVVGAALMFVLVVSVLMLVISAVAWGIGTWSGSPQVSTKGRVGVLVSLGGALMAGAAMTIVNVLINYGNTLS
ncbi:hypothetical protein G7066_08865 [Leucobacter coleopterorum]|uniref:Integral membrane protein n=1 Tax=Leucobacter coleopterorum TaxID=2714933 RepID=A0ABX6K0F9_9MICO|nr:DUF6112 family protein [Leucobacter coleopterorum]QIM18694.1 hypothetical protein G7066_08865 [Leucobacter coleopterorum]